MADEANLVALDRALELAGKVQGQPWPEARIIEVAETFRGFLIDETPTVLDRIAALENQVNALDTSVDSLWGTVPKPKPTRQRPKPEPSTTETNLPDQPLDPGPAPEPVDF